MNRKKSHIFAPQSLTDLRSKAFSFWYPSRTFRKAAPSSSQQSENHQAIVTEPDILYRDGNVAMSSTESFLAMPSLHCDEYERAVLHLARKFPIGEFEMWKQCEKLFPCVQLLYRRRSHFGSTVALSQAWGQILTNTAWYLWRRGYNQEAQDLVFEALSLRQSILGHDHEQTLISLEIAAGVLMSQGKYEQAEGVNRHALQGFRRTLGEQHPSTLTSVSNLALVLYQQGKYKDAEALGRQAMIGSKRILGKLHADTLKSVSNLALTLRQQGRYKEAARLSKKAFDGFLNTLGMDHPSTLTSMTNLAVVLECQGKLRQSQTFIWQAVLGKIRVLGIDHPSTLQSLSHVTGTTQ